MPAFFGRAIFSTGNYKVITVIVNKVIPSLSIDNITHIVFCFPGDNGNMVCRHWSGSWIVFPAGKNDHVKTPSTYESKDEVDTTSEKV